MEVRENWSCESTIVPILMLMVRSFIFLLKNLNKKRINFFLSLRQELIKS